MHHDSRITKHFNYKETTSLNTGYKISNVEKRNVSIMKKHIKYKLIFGFSKICSGNCRNPLKFTDMFNTIIMIYKF